MFNLKNLLYNQSWLAVVFGLFVMLLAMIIDRKWLIVLLVLYLAVIVYFTLMFRENGGAKVNFELFWSYKNIFSDSEIRADIFKNIWLFIPLGMILYRLIPKKIILLALIAFSVVIEAMQYFTGRGLCELDDVVSNGLGGFIGYGIGARYSGAFYERIHRWFKRTGVFL